MDNLLPMKELPLAYFRVQKSHMTAEGAVGMTLHAEASTVWGGPAVLPLQRIFADAADEGIAIRSHVTGNVERFYLRTIERDGNDIVAWHFMNIHSTARVERVIVWND